jgi:membrane fusion protein (multidrug efflux system)
MPDSAPAEFLIDAPAKAPPRRAGLTRTRLFGMLGAAILLVALIVVAYWLFFGQFRVTTDNAYVDATEGVVTPQVAGQVVDAPIYNTEPVKAGQVLVKIDDTDFRIALAEAQAQLGQAERKVRSYFANGEALAGQVASRDAGIVRADAQIAAAQSDLERAQTELGRRERLASSGAVSGDELTQSQNAFNNAKAALAQAKAAKVQAVADRTATIGAKDVNAALIAGSQVADNPEVAAAKAKVDQAQLDLDRTVLRAPFDGVIAKNTVAVGQRVAVGANLMSVVPIDAAYVDANFKEVQLKKVCLGQPVTLVSDYWGDGVKFHGRVTGLAGGTGAAFALIPAQNATGNWIKVVQRLPVRIDLTPDELRRRPLRVGLSMKATIDVSKPCGR